MNVLIVSGMFPPMQTGTAFYTLNLAKKLQGQGHTVEIVTLGGSGAETEWGIKVHRLSAFRLPMSGFFKHYQFCAWNPLNWWRLYRISRNCRADAILLVNHYLDIAFPAILAAQLSRIPLVCSVGTQLQSLNPRRNRILNVLDRLIVGFTVLPACDRIVAWDTQIRQYLLDVHGPRIAHKIDIVNFGVNGEPERLMSHSHDYNVVRSIVGVGAVSEQRSFVPLVRAFSLLVDRFPDLKLRIIGHVYFDAAQRLSAELGLGDRVEFVGELPHDEVMLEMGRATVFFASLTGKYVGIGTATSEAMLMGVPSVVNTPLDLLGTGVLVDGEHLLQCRDADAEQIAERLTELLQNAELRRRVGAGGRAFVSRYLNWDVVAVDIIAVLKQAAERRHAAAKT
jgi:1,2-diacylglycerol 3-alpha-glucosyltransferase